MITNLPGEKWKQIIFKNWELLQKMYAISNLGRMASYSKDIKKDGALLRGSTIEGYTILRLKVKDDYPAFLCHRLVADYFLKQPSVTRNMVIHLNHDKKDNRVANLKWASQEEVAKHNMENPAVLAAKQKAKENPLRLKKGLKLTLVQVKKIKQTLANPKRKITYRQMAEKYGISEMAITRIKNGENWGYVTV
jgi:hypothetical protein